jgi:hypothetical protein
MTQNSPIKAWDENFFSNERKIMNMPNIINKKNEGLIEIEEEW